MIHVCFLYHSIVNIDDGELQLAYKQQQRPPARPATSQSDVSTMDVQNPKALHDRAKVYLDNLRAYLDRSASNMRLGGNVPQAKSLTLQELQYKVWLCLLIKLSILIVLYTGWSRSDSQGFSALYWTWNFESQHPYCRFQRFLKSK